MPRVTGTAIRMGEDSTTLEQTVFDINDIMGVNRSVHTILAMALPGSVPHVEGVEDDAIAAHLATCQTDVGAWDGLLTRMSRLASDLNTYADDQPAALDLLSDLTRKAADLDTMTVDDRQGLLDDINDTFDTPRRSALSNETRATDFATDLRAFGATVSKDKTATDGLRGRYQAHIEVTNAEIWTWEKQHGMKPSADLAVDLRAQIDAVNDAIAADDATLGGFGTMTGAGCAIFVCTCRTGIGAVVGGSLIGVGSWQIDEARKDKARQFEALDETKAELA